VQPFTASFFTCAASSRPRLDARSRCSQVLEASFFLCLSSRTVPNYDPRLLLGFSVLRSERHRCTRDTTISSPNGKQDGGAAHIHLAEPLHKLTRRLYQHLRSWSSSPLSSEPPTPVAGAPDASISYRSCRLRPVSRSKYIRATYLRVHFPDRLTTVAWRDIDKLTREVPGQFANAPEEENTQSCIRDCSRSRDCYT
jgi:hypothetical protein